MKPKLVNSENDQTVRGVGLLNKAFQVLDLFSPEEPSWSQAEIGRAADLPRSTVSRLVRFLCARGYLTLHERTGRYTLGYGAIELGRRAQLQFNLANVALDILEDVSRQTRETVILTGFNPTAMQVVCLNQIPSQQGGLRVYESIGTTFPLYVGASAKPVLAHLPGPMAERVLTGDMPPINPAWVQSEAKLRVDIEQIRRRGFAVSFEETYPGVAGIGAAIVDPGGFPLGCIAIAVPLQRLSESDITKFGQLLIVATGTVNARLSGTLDKADGVNAEAVG